MRSSRTLLVICALALGGSAVAVRAPLATERAAMPDDADVLYVPEPAYLAPMSLGYKEALADLLWVRALVFSGVSLGMTNVPAIDRYAHAIAGLSPRFERVYQWGGVTAIYGGGPTITRDMVDTAIALYRDGLVQYPESHTLLYGLGMLLTHQVSSTPGYTAEEKDAYAAEGVDLIRRAAAFGADPLVRQYAATLISDHATDALARQFLESELARVEDPDYRRLLKKKLGEIGAATSIEAVERVREAFISEHQAQAPYLPDAVYSVTRDGATRAHATPTDQNERAPGRASDG